MGDVHYDPERLDCRSMEIPEEQEDVEMDDGTDSLDKPTESEMPAASEEKFIKVQNQYHDVFKPAGSGNFSVGSNATHL
jgi:hypothetical protein